MPQIAPQHLPDVPRYGFVLLLRLLLYPLVQLQRHQNTYSFLGSAYHVNHLKDSLLQFIVKVNTTICSKLYFF